MATWLDALSRWIAWRLPRSVVYWATVRVGCHAMAHYPELEVGQLRIEQAVRCWEGEE